MSKSATRRNESSGTDTEPTYDRPVYRPTYFLLGVDQEGSHHVADLLTESVHVITPAGTREHRQPLNGHALEAYMDVIADGRGWGCELYGLSITELITRALDASE